jgi:hypothetical protein
MSDGSTAAEGDVRAVAATIQEHRDEVDALTDPDGQYAVACKDTGIRPEPVTDATFASYADAERACDAATAFRSAMRAVDPSLEEYDLVVSDTTVDGIEFATVREFTAERRENGLPRSRQTVTVAGDRADEWFRVENSPIVYLHGPDAPLDDEFVTRQLKAKL